MARNEHFVRVKSHEEVNFPLGSCTPEGVYLCTHIMFFFRRQMAPLQNAQFRTVFLVNFTAFSGRIASPIMDQFVRSFQHLLDEQN